MAKIKNQPPTPMWPWGGPRGVWEKLVDPRQLVDRVKSPERKADPKNPALASFALLDSIGPAHSAEEMRLPMPEMPSGHDADLTGFVDRPFLGSVSERGEGGARKALEQTLSLIKASAERFDRLKALLSREAQMLALIKRLKDDTDEIYRRMREEQQDQGY